MRVYIVMLTFLLMSVIMISRLVYLVVYEGDFLQDEGDARTIRTEKINAHRGMIRDTRGKPLAVSTPLISLWVNPSQFVREPEKMLAIAIQLEMPIETLRNKLQQNINKNFIYLKRHMPPSKAHQVLALEAKGVYGKKEYKRFYPTGEVATHVVGFTNINDKGQEGVELSYDGWLKGTVGKKKVLKNRHGEIVRDIHSLLTAVPGKDLDLSLDMRLQYLAYRDLKGTIKLHQAKSGSVVIVEVATGKILSLVNQPAYNPNNRVNLKIDSVRNRAVTDIFEPGSTVKPFTVAVALESNRYSADHRIDTSPGFIKVGSKIIPDPKNFRELDLASIIAHSSQVGISKLALDLDEYAIWTMFSDIGFGQSVGIGFPGESSGKLPNHRRWKDIERVSFAYGYGFQVTPLQLAGAYQIIASGGVKRRLSLIKEDLQEKISRIFSKSTADELKAMLAKVVTEGTGSRAAIAAYSSAGKTGTVRKVGKHGYEDTRHVAFFAGMAPVAAPKLVAVVMINEPKGRAYGGGVIAAPLFARVMSEALRLLNVPPTNIPSMNKEI